ncbi:MAG: hypothetical protein HRT72_03170 [Flavobacteriales bacterium]|nr:hypothetical protein [Flavobacteriales bacterium]
MPSTGSTLKDIANELDKLEDKTNKSKSVTTNIIEHLTAYSSGDYSHILDVEMNNLALDVVCLGLNDLGEELKRSTVSKNAFDEMFESLNSPFLIVDAATLNITKHNSNALTYFEYEKDTTLIFP